MPAFVIHREGSRAYCISQYKQVVVHFIYVDTKIHRYIDTNWFVVGFRFCFSDLCHFPSPISFLFSNTQTTRPNPKSDPNRLGSDRNWKRFRGSASPARARQLSTVSSAAPLLRCKRGAWGVGRGGEVAGWGSRAAI